MKLIGVINDYIQHIGRKKVSTLASKFIPSLARWLVKITLVLLKSE